MFLRLSLLSLLLAGCPAEDLPPNTGGPDAGSAYADTVIAFTENGNLVSCTDSLPVCGVGGGSCATHAALGAPDATTFALPAGGRLEMAFRCSAVIEHGSPGGTSTPDLQIWSTVPAGSQAIVEVSYDGSTYDVLDTLDVSDDTFDLERINTQLIRFVRIVDTGAGGIEIDALEAL